MLEPYEGKLSRTVLRGERGSNTPDLPDQVIEGKQKFISQIMTGKSPVRSCEDVDETTLNYAEVKALTTGNPLIKEKMSLDIEVQKLKLAKSAYSGEIYRLEDAISKNYPMKIAALKEKTAGYRADIAAYQKRKPKDKEGFLMTAGDKTYADKKQAGEALIGLCRAYPLGKSSVRAGSFLGFSMSLSFEPFGKTFVLNLQGEASHAVNLGEDTLGNITRISNALEGMEGKLAGFEAELADVEKNLAEAREAVKKPFPKERELAEKTARLSELNRLLDLDKSGGNRERAEDASLEPPDKTSEETGSQHEEAANQNGAKSETEAEYGWRVEHGSDSRIQEMDSEIRGKTETAKEKKSAEGPRPSVRMKLALFKQQLAGNCAMAACEERGQYQARSKEQMDRNHKRPSL